MVAAAVVVVYTLYQHAVAACQYGQPRGHMLHVLVPQPYGAAQYVFYYGFVGGGIALLLQYGHMCIAQQQKYIVVQGAVAHAVAVYSAHVLCQLAAFFQYPQRAYLLLIAGAVAHASQPSFFIVAFAPAGIAQHIIGFLRLLKAQGGEGGIIGIGVVELGHAAVGLLYIAQAGRWRDAQCMIMIFDGAKGKAQK